MLNRNDPMTQQQREALRGFFGEPIPSVGKGEAVAILVEIKRNNNNEPLTTQEIETLIGRSLS